MTSLTLDANRPAEPSGAPLSPPGAPAWRAALLPLAYAATLIAVLVPLSQLWPDRAGPAPSPSPSPPSSARAPAAATADVLAEQLGRKLARGGVCVESRWQAQSPSAVMSCLAAGYGVAQIFVAAPPNSGAPARALATDREQALDWSSAERLQRTAAAARLQHVPAPDAEAGASPGIDQIITMPAAQGSDVLVVRYRWQGLQLQAPNGEAIAGRDVAFRLGVAQAAPAEDSTLSVQIPEAGGLALVLRSPPATAAVATQPRGPDHGNAAPSGGWFDSAMPWLSLAALALLCVAGLALWLDQRWRAKERQYVADLNGQLQLNARLNEEQKALNEKLQLKMKEDQKLSESLYQLNRELIEVVHVNEQLHRWRNLSQLIVNKTKDCHDWLQKGQNAATSAGIAPLVDIALRQARSLAGELKMFSPQPGEPVPMPVHTLVAETFALTRQRAEAAGVELFSAISQNLPQVMVEQGPVKMALCSLLDNAIRAMAAAADGNAVLVVSAHQVDDGKRVRLTLRDSGSGMTEAQRKALEDHEIGKTGAADGHGVGVAHSRYILMRSKGELGRISTSAEGTAIEVLLPVAAPTEGSP